MTLENIDVWAKKKGINVVGTGDFTHPGWFSEIKTKLKPVGSGFYAIKSPSLDHLEHEDDFSDGRQRRQTYFILTAEISCIYSKAGRVRKIHHLVMAPHIEAVEKINTRLGWLGNLKSDGRPILGLDSRKLLEIVLKADPRCVLIPAHAWTPWFSIFGSMSGFDSIEECFGDYSRYIFSIETGLSSDPLMNWRLSSLDGIALVSNSDAHSLVKLGREANVFKFDTDFSYDGLVQAVKSKDPERFLYTIEFFPEEGKYHYDGHRLCGVSLSPDETKKREGVCPNCGKRVTIGVLNRVNSLADRRSGERPNNAIPYKSLVPLMEIIAEVKGVGAGSKTVIEEYNNLISKVGPEFYILIDAPTEKISEVAGFKIAEGVKRVREGRVRLKPGYDGEFGKVTVFQEGEEIEAEEGPKQTSLF
jgi:uncharacterized protein (TIGR00375 family)